MIYRRASLTGLAAAGVASLARPSVVRAAPRVLRMVPQANLVSFDPITSTANITRNFGFMVYDTLYGMSSALEPSPQMAEGHATDYGGRRTVIFLREGLKFHDGTPVLARDVVASLNRWMARNPFGQKLATATSSLSALDDRRIQIVLRRPFPLLFHGLAGLSQPAFIMPEPVARTDPFKEVEETVGSGPFRFKRDEFKSGSLAVFERNPAYQPAGGAPSLTAGGKVVNFDRVEWRTMPDAAAAGAALQQGDVDWYELPPPELQTALRRNRNILVERLDPMPSLAVMRLNHLHPPFADVAVRRALLPAIDQRDFMAAVVGTESGLAFTDVGVYTPGTPNASRIGLEPLLGARNVERSREALTQAGRADAPMRLIGPNDVRPPAAMTQVAAELFRRLGLNQELALSDWGDVIARRTNHEALDRGGWSALLTSFSSFDCMDPALHPLLRGNGLQGWPGWPTLPRLEALRDEWFNAEEQTDRARVAGEIQRVAIDEVAFIPVGAYLQPTALRRNLVDRVPGFAIFWGLRSA